MESEVVIYTRKGTHKNARPTQKKSKEKEKYEETGMTRAMCSQVETAVGGCRKEK
jgi:hypothetical protein